MLEKGSENSVSGIHRRSGPWHSRAIIDLWPGIITRRARLIRIAAPFVREAFARERSSPLPSPARSRGVPAGEVGRSIEVHLI